MSSVSVLALVAAVLGVAFAGSPAKLAPGLRIAGVDVGGLTAEEALGTLERRSRALKDVPVVFAAGSQRWPVRPSGLSVEVDWRSAVEGARRQGRGFAPIRGLRRLQVRFFGADIAPPARVYEPALDYQLGLFAQAIGRRPREAAIELRGLEPVVVPGQSGRTLDRAAAAVVVVRALASFRRGRVALPVRVDEPSVTAGDLAPVAARIRTALSAPVRLALGPTRWRLPRWRIAQLLELPKDGSRSLTIAGPGADRYFARLADTVRQPPQDAGFATAADGSASVVPGVKGRELDVLATARALLAAALSPRKRLAEVAVRSVQPELTTAEAHRMGIERLLASYSTAYAGTSDRIHNLQLAVSLLDGALIAPGATFSLNARVGPRTEERGFRVAPVIVGGKYEEAVGGGVSQVATTVFNAAWEAGLKITARAAHALYISRYPLGRDATVNYPDLDLKFVNDTGRWLLLRGSAGQTGIAISLYGAPTGRRVVSEASPLTVVGPAPLKRIRDPSLPAGVTVVEEAGSPARATSVRRVVYDADGDVLYSETWYSRYRGEPRVIRVGTKPKPKQKQIKKKGKSSQPEPSRPALNPAALP